MRLSGRRAALSVLSLWLTTTLGCSGADGADVGSSGSAVGTSANQTAFDFFRSKGLTAVQAAGIVGNLDQESDMEPTVSEFGGGPGRGIAQWSAGGRWDTERDDNVIWYAAQQGESAESLTLQLQFVWYELETFSAYGLSALEAATTVTSATDVFASRFEACGTCDLSRRVSDAETALNAYGNDPVGVTTTSPDAGSSTENDAAPPTADSGTVGATGPGCFSHTLDRNVANNACVQDSANSEWYQCDSGAWVDRWTDPAACSGIYPL